MVACTYVVVNGVNMEFSTSIIKGSNSLTDKYYIEEYYSTVVQQQTAH